MTTLLTDDSTLTDELLSDHIRSVTDEEVAFYDENGWVKLSGLLSPELTSLILKHVQSAAGYIEEDGFTEAFTDLDKRGETRTAWYSTNLHHKDDFLKQLARSRRLGEVTCAADARKPGSACGPTPPTRSRRGRN